MRLVPIKHYDNCENILKDFFEMRRKHYGKRYKYMINKLEEELLLLSVKVRFILDVINKKIIIYNRPKANITEQLETFKYPKMLQGHLIKLEELSKMSAVKRSDASYDFLIRMPIYNLTKEKIEELKERINIQSRTELVDNKIAREDFREIVNEFNKSY